MNLPVKPKGMSEKRYRELYDSTPVFVIVDDLTILKCSGLVSGTIIANTYIAKGHNVRIEEKC